MFGRLAQTYIVLIQPLTNVKARQFLTWYGCSNREESTDTCLQPFWLNTRRVLWLMEHRDWRPWKEHKEGGSKEMDHCASKGIQLWHSLGVYHNISLCLHKVCMQPLQPEEKSVCYDIPSVCRTRQSLGKVSHTFQSFLSIVGFPLLCFWMPLKNHKNFPSCGVSSLLPQNETKQNEKQLDQKEIY